MDQASVYFLQFSEKNINYVSQLVSNSNGSIKKLHEFQREYNVHENFYFQWIQFIDSSQKHGNLLSKKTVKILVVLSFMTITQSKSQEL